VQRFFLISLALHIGLLTMMSLPVLLQEPVNVYHVTLAPQAGNSGNQQLNTPLTEAIRPVTPPDKVSKTVTPARPEKVTPIPANKNITREIRSIAQSTPGVVDGQKSQQDTARILQDSLYSAIKPQFYYPRLARQRGWQGEVHVGLRVEADGHLSSLRIIQTSGYSMLDSAALSTLRKVAYIPEAKVVLNGLHFDMVLPVIYQLVDG
jgi:protein TonB